MSPGVVTFGCRTNMYESELIRQHAVAVGLSETTVIVNTCAVTSEAERQARQVIRRLKREQPDVRIIVTGCAAQLRPWVFSAMPEVHRVLSNAEKLKAETWIGDRNNISRPISKQENYAVNCDVPLLTMFDKRARAFLAIQHGCEHCCTFCVVPFVRGTTSYSIPPSHVIAQARALAAAGYRELVLTGIDLTAYGLDLPSDSQPGLGRLVSRLLTEVHDLKRLRLSSLDPIEIDEELFKIFGAEHRLMPHIHLSVQAGDDLILKRMKRRHGRTDILRVAERLQTLRPEVTLGADLIVGFPTESEAMFANTLDLVTRCNFTHIHVFPFSARPGTPAARMPAVTSAVVRERVARLRAAGNESMTRFLARRVGTFAKVLVERPNFGHSEDYLSVRLSSMSTPGAIVQVRLYAATVADLCGDILS